jgi:hypothetical protein
MMLIYHIDIYTMLTHDVDIYTMLMSSPRFKDLGCYYFNLMTKSFIGYRHILRVRVVDLSNDIVIVITILIITSILCYCFI